MISMVDSVFKRLLSAALMLLCLLPSGALCEALSLDELEGAADAQPYEEAAARSEARDVFIDRIITLAETL